MAVNLFLLPQYIVMCKLRKISVKLAYLELSHTVNYFHGIFLIKVKFHDFQSLQHTTHTAVLCDVWKSKQLTVKQISFFVKSIESKRLQKKGSFHGNFATCNCCTATRHLPQFQLFFCEINYYFLQQNMYLHWFAYDYCSIALNHV